MNVTTNHSLFVKGPAMSRVSGPFLGVEAVLTPLIRVKQPQLQIYYRPVVGTNFTPFMTIGFGCFFW